MRKARRQYWNKSEEEHRAAMARGKGGRDGGSGGAGVCANRGVPPRQGRKRSCWCCSRPCCPSRRCCCSRSRPFLVETTATASNDASIRHGGKETNDDSACEEKERALPAWSSDHSRLFPTVASVLYHHHQLGAEWFYHFFCSLQDKRIFHSERRGKKIAARCNQAIVRKDAQEVTTAGA